MAYFFGPLCTIPHDVVGPTWHRLQAVTCRSECMAIARVVRIDGMLGALRVPTLPVGLSEQRELGPSREGGAEKTRARMNYIQWWSAERPLHACTFTLINYWSRIGLRTAKVGRSQRLRSAKVVRVYLGRCRAAAARQPINSGVPFRRYVCGLRYSAPVAKVRTCLSRVRQ